MTHKMKFGNRGMNHPGIDLTTTRCYTTPCNHSFVIDEKTLPKDSVPFTVNFNNGSNEEMIHSIRLWFPAHFHPEDCDGQPDPGFPPNHYRACEHHGIDYLIFGAGYPSGSAHVWVAPELVAQNIRRECPNGILYTFTGLGEFVADKAQLQKLVRVALVNNSHVIV